jgi:DNA-binding transcriptional LysR family regulator
VREFEFVPLFEDELRFLVGPQHAWAQAGGVPRSRISEETFVMYNKKSYTFRLVSEYFMEEKIAPANFIELGSMEAIKELVKIGLGVGIIAPWIAQKELASGALVSFPLGRRRLKREWAVAYLRGRRLPAAEEKFIALSQVAAKNIQSVQAE